MSCSLPGFTLWNGVGVFILNAAVTGNTEANVSAGQGSRLEWYGGQVDAPIFCGYDGSVLTSGDASCPEPSGQ